MNTPTKRTARRRAAGRPPGTDNSRERLLELARDAFASRGYEATSLRAIAAAGEVNASTLIHYFGSKEGLYAEVVAGIAPLTADFVAALASGADGRSLVTHYLQMWENPEGADALRAVMRTALASPTGMAVFRQTLTTGILKAGHARSPLQMELLMSHLWGIGLSRYFTQLPALSQASIRTIAETAGPVLDRYLAR